MLSRNYAILNFNNSGLFWAPYPHWKTLRSFAISSLREEGMGKASMEPQVLEEIEQYLGAFVEPNLNQPINMRQGLSQATCNIVSQLMYSKRFDYNDEGFKAMMSAIFEVGDISVKIAIASSLPIPFLRYLLKSLHDRSEHLSKKVIIPTLQSYIDEHKIDIDRENPRDLTDRFIIHSEEVKDEQEHCYSG